MPSDQKLTEQQIKGLLGPPPLIGGENVEAYWNWWSAFVKAYDPESLIEWLQVNEYATKNWEQLRLQRYNSVIVENAMAKALQNLLTNFESGRNFGLNAVDRECMILEYFSASEKERKPAVQQVESWGISREVIMAEAMRLRADTLVVLDKLDNQRANAKRMVLKDLDRRLEARRKSSDPEALQ
jgi:hypothetical protein